MQDGINQAKFCAFRGKFCTAAGRLSAKGVTLMPSIIPNTNAIAVTGVTTAAGFFQNFQKKLKIMN